MPSDTDVIIIGAGSAGLSAARELDRLGLTYRVLEGSHRIGGRGYSEELARGVWLDVGGAWLVGGADNPFVGIADELGIPLDKNNSDSYLTENHRFQRNGKPLDANQRAACLRFYDDSYSAITAITDQGRDVAISDVIDIEHEFSAPFLCSIASSWGVDSDLVSSVDFESTIGELGFQALHGYGNLIAAWGADVEVSLNTRVDRIDWSGKGVTVETPKGSVSGRTVLSTVSTGMLASGEILFSPGLPDWKTDAINGLPMGTENKMGVYFDADVFGTEGRGHYSIWNDDGKAAKIDAQVVGLNTAVVFVGGRHGIWLEKQGPAACHDFAVDRIAEIFGHDIRKHVNKSITTAWNSEPWTRGSWACALPGQGHQRASLQRPVAERLFFAGEATVVGEQGTCHGAYQSGIQTAREIASQLNTNPQSQT